MRKKLSIFIFLCIFLAFCACYNKENTVSSTSVVDSASDSSSQTSLSKDTSTTLSSSDASNSTSLSEEDEEEAIPVEDDATSQNEAFLPDYDKLEGSYETKSGKVASASIESFGCEVTMKINMERNEASHYEWELTATLDGSKLIYTGACCMIVTNTVDNPDYEVVYLDGEGFFEVKEGKLYWTGATEADNQNCVFEKIK